MEKRIQKLETQVQKLTKSVHQCQRMPAQIVRTSVETQVGVTLSKLVNTEAQTECKTSDCETQTYALNSVTERGIQVMPPPKPFRRRVVTPQQRPVQQQQPKPTPRQCGCAGPKNTAADRLLQQMKSTILPALKDIDDQWFKNEHQNGTLNHDVNAVCQSLQAIKNRKFTTENVVEVLTVSLNMFVQTYSNFYNEEEPTPLQQPLQQPQQQPGYGIQREWWNNN